MVFILGCASRSHPRLGLFWGKHGLESFRIAKSPMQEGDALFGGPLNLLKHSRRNILAL
jgi:hypothetical protein